MADFFGSLSKVIHTSIILAVLLFLFLFFGNGGFAFYKGNPSLKDLIIENNITTGDGGMLCIKNKKFDCSEGSQFRDFVHVEDVVEAIIKSLANENARGKIINVGSGQPRKIRNIY